MNKVFWASLIVLAGFIALAAWLGVFSGSDMREDTVRVREVSFRAEVAETPVTRGRGLSGRKELAENAAMLFIFQNAGSPGFWMKDMNFPLDIIWINGSRIVGIEKNAQPQPDASVFGLKTYYPPAPADKVLEINAGLSDKYGFEAGDEVVIGAGGA